MNSDAGETLRLEPMGGPGFPARFFFGVLQQPASSASLTALGKGGVVLERRALTLG